ncbi:hypothetical protein BGZ92_007059 [Podila epicladia]|nr:hypothetical protein BGZ92_007059 [Podila epicladia]
MYIPSLGELSIETELNVVVTPQLIASLTDVVFTEAARCPEKYKFGMIVDQANAFTVGENGFANILFACLRFSFPIAL